jgi:hypothetical protein
MFQSYYGRDDDLVGAMVNYDEQVRREIKRLGPFMTRLTITDTGGGEGRGGEGRQTIRPKSAAVDVVAEVVAENSEHEPPRLLPRPCGTSSTAGGDHQSWCFRTNKWSRVNDFQFPYPPGRCLVRHGERHRGDLRRAGFRAGCRHRDDPADRRRPHDDAEPLAFAHLDIDGSRWISRVRASRRRASEPKPHFVSRRHSMASNVADDGYSERLPGRKIA